MAILYYHNLWLLNFLHHLIQAQYLLICKRDPTQPKKKRGAIEYDPDGDSCTPILHDWIRKKNLERNGSIFEFGLWTTTCGLGFGPKIDLYKDINQTVQKSNCFVVTEKRTRMIWTFKQRFWFQTSYNWKNLQSILNIRKDFI